MTAEKFKGAFAGKTVLVTGHTGFKGAWLSLWLTELRAKVVGLALAPEGRLNLYKQLGVESMIDSRIGDVRNLSIVRRVVEEVKPAIIFHLAAQSLVRRSYQDPLGTFETNVLGTLNILEAARGTGSVRVCQIVTSDKCYRNDGSGAAFREDDPLGGRDPYSASKACAEVAVSAFRESFAGGDNSRLSISSVRAGNVIGGGDWAEDRILPDCARALSEEKQVEVRNPAATRPWQFVLEPLSGYLWLAARQLERPGEFAEAWNFGPQAGQSHPVKAVVEKVINLWEGGKWISTAGGDGLHEAPSLRLDSSKAEKRLRWKPAYELEEALSESVAWYKAFFKDPGFVPIEFSRKQIGRYAQAAQRRRLPWASPGS